MSCLIFEQKPDNEANKKNVDPNNVKDTIDDSVINPICQTQCANINLKTKKQVEKEKKP